MSCIAFLLSKTNVCAAELVNPAPSSLSVKSAAVLMHASHGTCCKYNQMKQQVLCGSMHAYLNGKVKC